MRHTVIFTVCMLLAALPALAQLDGKTITVKGGKADVVNAPVSVACAEAAPAGRVVVTDAKGKKEYPATLADGTLVFIVDKLKAGETKEFKVKTGAEGDPGVSLEKRAEGDIVDVKIDGKIFTAYHYGKEWKKPFLWPITSENGVTLTRDYPMDPNGKPQDHPHHKSMWSAYGDINGVDLWAEGENSGTQTAQEVTWGSGDAYGWIKSKNLWVDGAGKPVLSETREYRFYATPEAARFIDVNVTFTADQGDVQFNDTKEGGIVAVRMRHEMCNKNAVITNALGDKDEENCWGKPSPWCDFSAELKGSGWFGITIFDNPGNLRFPGSWHVRAYGLMGANSFGYSFYNEKAYNKGLIPERGDMPLKSGESKAFNYRVYVHAGDVEKARVADRFANYAEAPAAEIK